MCVLRVFVHECTYVCVYSCCFYLIYTCSLAGYVSDSQKPVGESLCVCVCVCVCVRLCGMCVCVCVHLWQYGVCVRVHVYVGCVSARTMVSSFYSPDCASYTAVNHVRTVLEMQSLA